MRPTVALVAALVNLAVPALAQTTNAYQAPTGSVSPALVITMNLSDGGHATLNPVVGPNCYLGMTCAFPAGYVGTDMSYALSDGSTANLPDFNGTFFPLGSNNYGLSGQASGTDSLGRNVTVDSVQVSMHITCRSGRGGGCTKTYTGGTLTITLNGPAPTATPTAVATPTIPPSSTPTPMDLMVISARLKPASATAANGFAAVVGEFIVSSDGSFDLSEGITLDVQATGFDADYTWDPSQCLGNGFIHCVSPDRNDRLFVGAPNAAGMRAFTARFRKLDAVGQFAGPVTVTLTDENTGNARSGTLKTCAVQRGRLVCG